MSRYYDITVATRLASKTAIESVLEVSDQHNLNFIFVHHPFGLEGYSRKASPGLVLILCYWLWHVKLYFVVRDLLNRRRFDLIHHLSWAGVLHSGFLAFLNPPLVIGPAGGGQKTPVRFLTSLGVYAPIEILRSIWISVQTLNPLTRLTAKRVGCLLACNRETEDFARKLGFRCVYRMSLSGIKITGESEIRRSSERNTTFLMVGRMYPTKGQQFAINAFSKVVRMGYDAKLVIVGDGPFKHKLLKLVRDSDAGERIEICSWVDAQLVQEFYLRADVLVHPAIRESFGMVVLEAMSFGLPIITLDHQGMRDIVTDDCGIKVRPLNPRQVERDLAFSMVRLIIEPNLRLIMGKAAYNRARHEFGWVHLVEQMVDYYEATLSLRQSAAEYVSPSILNSKT